MNCQQCGHPKEKHEGRFYGCAHCMCGKTQAEIELHHAQTRLQLARAVIEVLSHNGLMPENLMVDKGEAWRAWTEEMKK